MILEQCILSILLDGATPLRIPVADFFPKMSPLLYFDQNVWKPNISAVFDQLEPFKGQARSSKCQMPPEESFNLMNFMSFVVLTAHLIVSTSNSANNNK